MKYLKLTVVFIASFVFRLNWRTLLPSEGGRRDEIDCGEAEGDEREFDIKLLVCNTVINSVVSVVQMSCTWSIIRAVSGVTLNATSVSCITSGIEKESIFPLPMPTSTMTSLPHRTAAPISNCHAKAVFIENIFYTCCKDSKIKVLMFVYMDLWWKRFWAWIWPGRSWWYGHGFQCLLLLLLSGDKVSILNHDLFSLEWRWVGIWRRYMCITIHSIITCTCYK